MKPIILILAILVFPLAGLSSAENYSCRDANDRLHIADNPMSLPEECRNQAVNAQESDSGKVSYVPPVSQNSQHNESFAEAVAEEEQQLRQRSLAAENLLHQARSLADDYENSVASRKTAMRSQKYGFRKTVISADQGIQSARKEKEILLDKIKKTRLTSTQKGAILNHLNRIKN